MSELMVSFLIVGAFALIAFTAYRLVIDTLDRWQTNLESRQQAFSETLSAAERLNEKRQQVFDKAFEEQLSRLQARDKEIDLLIADIPKRIDYQMQSAVSRYVVPFQEDHARRAAKAREDLNEDMSMSALGQDDGDMSLEEILSRLDEQGGKV